MSSKSKGNAYERKIAKVLGEYWGEEFHRTPGSGSLHGWSADLNVAGDIVTSPHSAFPFVVECKNRQAGNWTLESVMLDTHDVKNWWKQVVEDSMRVNKIPMLIFTRNRAKDFVMLPYNVLVAEHFTKLGITQYMETYVSYEDETTQTTSTYYVSILPIDEFLKVDKRFWEETYPECPDLGKGYFAEDRNEVHWTERSLVQQKEEEKVTDQDELMGELFDSF